jgi:peptidoglycan/LPS O-acetylase OafA/YrhL
MSERLPYVPALDGLRGVAVIAVLLHHGQVSWARGGFLGVDVFFVLSGYLITTLLVREQASTGRIELRAFWSRRARRLLPALLAVVTAVAAYAAWLAPSASLGRLRGDALATLGYVANWRFIAAGDSYFDQFTAPSPLRHMWSLAIEEQWYAVWPLVVVGLLVKLRVTATEAFALTVLTATGSALLTVQLGAATDPVRVYYGTDTRAQALLVGGALAFALAARSDRAAEALAGRGARLGGVVGLLTLAVLLILADGGSRWLYQGGLTVAALAAAGVVVGALAAGGPVSRLLALEPLRLIGVVSYGGYLWHWPIYVLLTPDRLGVSGAALLAVRLVTTLAVAAASYRLIERPIRVGTWRVRVPHAAVAVSVIAVAVVVTTAGAPVDPSGVPAAALPSATVKPPSLAASPTASQTPAAGSTSPGTPTSTSPDAPPPSLRAFVLGDSVAYNLIMEHQPEHTPGLVVDGSSQLGCGLLPGRLVVGGRVEPLPEQCPGWSDVWQRQAGAADADLFVVLVGIGELFTHVVDGERLEFGTDRYAAFLEAELEQTIRRLGASSRRRVALLTVPCHDKPDTGLDRSAAVVNDRARHDWLNGQLSEFAAARTETVTLVDWGELLCPGGDPDAKVGGVEMRPDGVHLSDPAVGLAWRWLTPRLLAAARQA